MRALPFRRGSFGVTAFSIPALSKRENGSPKKALEPLDLLTLTLDNPGMRTTAHFDRDVTGPNRLPGREGITYERCVQIVQERRHEAEEGGERVFWGLAPELPGETKWLKVVTDAAGEILVTAYKDRRFARKVERGEV